MEENKAMDAEDTTNYCTEQEVGEHDSTLDEYFEKIIVCKYLICHGKKQFN